MTMVPSCLSPMGERAAEQVSERWRVAGTQHGLCGWQGCPLLDWSGQLLSWSSRALLDLVHRPRPPALDLEKFPPDFGAQQWNPGAWLGVGHPVCTLRGWGGVFFPGKNPTTWPWHHQHLWTLCPGSREGEAPGARPGHSGLHMPEARRPRAGSAQAMGTRPCPRAEGSQVLGCSSVRSASTGSGWMPAEEGSAVTMTDMV